MVMMMKAMEIFYICFMFKLLINHSYSHGWSVKLINTQVRTKTQNEIPATIATTNFQNISEATQKAFYILPYYGL